MRMDRTHGSLLAGSGSDVSRESSHRPDCSLQARLRTVLLRSPSSSFSAENLGSFKVARASYERLHPAGHPSGDHRTSHHLAARVHDRTPGVATGTGPEVGIAGASLSRPHRDDHQRPSRPAANLTRQRRERPYRARTSENSRYAKFADFERTVKALLQPSTLPIR